MKIQSSVKTVSQVLMISTIILIGAFQFYWVNRLYKDELQSLQKETDVLFRDVVYKLQLQRFRSDTAFFKKGIPDNLFVFDVIDSVKESFIDSSHKTRVKGKLAQVMISTRDDHRDSGDGRGRTDRDTEIFTRKIEAFNLPVPPPGEAPRIINFISNNKSFSDTLSIRTIDSAYKIELLKAGITLPFRVRVFLRKEDQLKDSVQSLSLKTGFAFIGLSGSQAYRAEFEDPSWYILSRIKLPILFSLLLVAITIASFIFLYRNLVSQRKLAVIKNEFISNITHELKTPIATVNVAIEALRNFNAIQSAEKTKEYLDISASELQRLSLLVDNVLRLSMFESKAIELKKEPFDIYELANEIILTMKLQFEKANASISIEKKGERFVINADKLHISSMIYNLLDNALKYSNTSPQVKVELIAHKDYIELLVADNGIGIAPEYRQKVFEKFFRVPTGSHHNAKGYGLGLSYVSHIARLHMGFAEVNSDLGKGSTFSVKLPFEEKDVINYDKGRVIRKERI